MNDVSRETPSWPVAAEGVFASAALPRVARFADLLATAGVERGMIGPREADRLWDRHVLNSAALLELLPTAGTVCDIGTGAGLPGIVLALARPDVEFTLVEPLLRRTTFLEEVCAHFRLDNVEVIRERADALHGRRRFDAVTSRAVAPLERLLCWSMPLVAPDGALIALKGDRAARELAAVGPLLREGGCTPGEVVTVGASFLTEPTHVVRVSWAGNPQVGWWSARDRAEGRRSRRRRK